MKKLFLCLLTVLMMLFSFTACGSVNEPEPDPGIPDNSHSENANDETEGEDTNPQLGYPSYEALIKKLEQSGFYIQEFDTAGFDDDTVPARRIYASKGDAARFGVCYNIDSSKSEFVIAFFEAAMPLNNKIEYLENAGIVYCIYSAYGDADADTILNELGFVS